MQCTAETTVGNQCKNKALTGSQYCRIHAGLSNGSNSHPAQRERSPSPVLYVLLLLQVLVTFLFGILGSTVAQRFDVAPGILIVVSVAAIALSFGVTVAFTYVQARRQLPASLRFDSVKKQLGTVFSALPVGFIAGAMVSGFVILATGRGQVFRPLRGLIVWDYELATFLVDAFLVGFVALRRSDVILTVSFAIANALGIAGVILLLHPHTNKIEWTVLGWLGILVALAFCAHRPWFRAVARFFRPPEQE